MTYLQHTTAPTSSVPVPLPLILVELSSVFCLDSLCHHQRRAYTQLSCCQRWRTPTEQISSCKPRMKSSIFPRMPALRSCKKVTFSRGYCGDRTGPAAAPAGAAGASALTMPTGSGAASENAAAPAAAAARRATARALRANMMILWSVWSQYHKQHLRDILWHCDFEVNA